MKSLSSLFLMAATALFAACATGCSSAPDAAAPAPITKPAITISDRTFSPEALWAMGRIGSVVAHAPSSTVAYTTSYYSVPENRSTTWLRLARYERKDSAAPTLTPLSERVGSSPAWTKDGHLLYLRSGQLYLSDGRDASNDRPLTGFDRPIEGFLLSPDEQRILLVATVPSHPTTADTHPDLPLSTGRVIDDLMYKHWDEWVDCVPQPFLCSLSLSERSFSVSGAFSLLEGTVFESPMRPFGGVEQLSFSPDGQTVAYTCRKKTGLAYALSTNSDIYLYHIPTGETTNITAPNQGYDTNPSFSPSGRYLAYLSMEHDGYESDLNRLFLYDIATKERFFVSSALDSHVDEYAFVDDSTLVFASVWHGTERLYRLSFAHPSAPSISRISPLSEHDYFLGDMIGNDLLCLRHSFVSANEIFALSAALAPADKTASATPTASVNPTTPTTPETNTTPTASSNPSDPFPASAHFLLTQLTFENDPIYSQIDTPQVAARWQTTTDGQQMLTWVIYPPHFDPSKQYPTLLFCQGGPQSPVSQFWSFRWNFMLMASQGYIVVAPNRRGLPGFGQDWNAAISGDYGGQCMRDYLTAIDDICTEPYVDRAHLGCVGASFGGYSVYWLAGHHDKRFSAFIAHDGIFNMEMQYLETEEKWFANWDMGGAYWDQSNPTAQRTFANSPHRFVDRWDTPILCIHGEKDYRILSNQAMAAFDAAKMRGVPAQLLLFPDENHWVLQPQNGILWQRTFFAWLDRYLKPTAAE